MEEDLATAGGVLTPAEETAGVLDDAAEEDGSPTEGSKTRGNCDLNKDCLCDCVADEEAGGAMGRGAVAA